jgi:hypothetical protein
VRLAPLSSLCHTNEYIHLQKNYNSPKGLNPDFQDLSKEGNREGCPYNVRYPQIIREQGFGTSDTYFRNRNRTDTQVCPNIRNREQGFGTSATYFCNRNRADTQVCPNIRNREQGFGTSATYFQNGNQDSGKRIFNQKQEEYQ